MEPHGTSWNLTEQARNVVERCGRIWNLLEYGMERDGRRRNCRIVQNILC